MNKHVEKPSGTSAATTAFCATKIEYAGQHLWMDGNGKITAGNGTLDDPKPNAFSLVQVEDCPFSTMTCRESCYVWGLQKHAPETHALYVHNSQEIKRILACGGLHPMEWAIKMGQWINENCQGGFRWHVSGDIFSKDYATFIAAVCLNSRPVRHWIYTRSFAYLDRLAPVSSVHGGNLAINLSCDKDNYYNAVAAQREFGGRLCFLTRDGNVPDLPDGSVIFPDYNLRGGTERGHDWFRGLLPIYKSFVCPVDYSGKSENRRCGPCDRCLR